MGSLNKSLLRIVRADRRGAAALEFALVAPLLFSMMLGVIEYGFVFYGYTVMQTGANQVARAIAVNSLPVSGAEDRFDSLMPGWIQNATVQAVQSNPADPTRSFINMRAQTTAQSITPIAIFTRAFPLTLTADVSVKQELPYDN